MFPTSGGCDTKVTFFVIALNVNKLLSCDVLRIYAPRSGELSSYAEREYT